MRNPDARLFRETVGLVLVLTAHVEMIDVPRLQRRHSSAHATPNMIHVHVAPKSISGNELETRKPGNVNTVDPGVEASVRLS